MNPEINLNIPVKKEKENENENEISYDEVPFEKSLMYENLW